MNASTIDPFDRTICGRPWRAAFWKGDSMDPNFDVAYLDALDQSDALEQRLIHKLEKIDQKLPQPAHYRVSFARDGYQFKAQIAFQARRNEIIAEASADDLYKAVDQAGDRAARQVSRLHDKLNQR